MWWNPHDDKFTFRTNFHKVNYEIIEGTKRPTKREVLKVIMSVFDPLGFLSNLMIQGKIILQDIWRSHIGWDDDVIDIINEKWKIWLRSVRKISEFSLPRQLTTFDRSRSTVQLHVFGDASELAYATVLYLRWQCNDKIKVSFVTAKTRVSPLKPTSIPRLELQAALIGARLSC